jgi:hypothetical protein
MIGSKLDGSSEALLDGRTGFRSLGAVRPLWRPPRPSRRDSLARFAIFSFPIILPGKAKLMLRAIIAATAIGLAAPSDAQVKVITGDVEHVYGPGGQILDDPQLKAKNQRARRQTPSAGPVEQQRLSVQQSGPSRVPNSWWSNDAARRQPPKSWWNNNGYQPPKSAWSQ